MATCVPLQSPLAGQSRLTAESANQQCYNRWVLASNNKGKLNEFKRLFSESKLWVEMVSQAELKIESAEETGLSFVENAIIKARHASRISGLPAIADDSGLCVPVLDNAPGIYSARFAGENSTDAENNDKLIETVRPLRGKSGNLPISAYFVCVLVMVRHADDPLPIVAQGVWEGEIAEKPMGDNGFGYDPIFWVPSINKTVAELNTQTKNQLSHRGRAIRSMLKQLKSR